MDNHQQNLQEEIAYLKRTVEFICEELELEACDLADEKSDLIASRKDMCSMRD